MNCSCTAAESALAPSLLCLDLPVLLGPKAGAPTDGAEGGGAFEVEEEGWAPPHRRGGKRRGGGGGGPPRLSPLGASVLICVLGYGQGACRQFTDR